MPYLVHMLTDVFPQIRAEAIFVITEVLAAFRVVPRDESRLLIDYVFPRLVQEQLTQSGPSVRLEIRYVRPCECGEDGPLE